MPLVIKAITYHRNGVAGNGFHVVLFDGSHPDHEAGKNMVATVFPDAGNVAVLDADLAAAGNIVFAQNSWRGDIFEADLRAAIKMYGDSPVGLPQELAVACCNTTGALRDAVIAAFAAEPRHWTPSFIPRLRDLLGLEAA